MHNSLAPLSNKMILLSCLKPYTNLLSLFNLFNLQVTILDSDFLPNIFSQHLLSSHKSQHATQSLSKGYIDYFKTKITRVAVIVWIQIIALERAAK